MKKATCLMRLFLSVFLFFSTTLYVAAEILPRNGWAVHTTSKSHSQLVKDTRAAVKAGGMFVVTQAGPTEAAKKRGIDIPGNRVIGVFNNDYAVKVLATSTAAMIEAPIRLYVTENADGTATLSYKTPTTIFAPYIAEAGTELKTLSTELDAIFADIAEAAKR